LTLSEIHTVSSSADGFFALPARPGYRLISASNENGYSGENFGHSAGGQPHGYLYQWNSLKPNAQNIPLSCILVKA
jgi:hypothetical protein